MSDTVVIDANAPLIVVGCGNTGSPFAALIPSIPGAGPVLFVDYDSYEAKNLVSQRILPCDVGKPKAAVQARWLRRFGVRATAAFVGRIEDVPWGWLRGGILVSCVDSRGARLYMNQVAWRLGLPLVDVAVDGPDLLARVSVYLSGDDAPCLECAWHEGHYRNLAKEYHCDGSTAATAATNAPSALGALAAGLQAIEVSALLGTGLKAPAVSRQAMFDLRNQTCTVTRFTRNPACRFDHQRWDIRILDVRPEDVALGDVFAEAALSREPSALSLEHRRFTRA
ncbi:MAG TPA: ThiF family adenylyltransferase, partial [Candidatus Hydrogenedentes bacterium]|nr:ThiF family adenylyltransferase [Candidatus Hydrogenedentota bacterium]